MSNKWILCPDFQEPADIGFVVVPEDFCPFLAFVPHYCNLCSYLFDDELDKNIHIWTVHCIKLVEYEEHTSTDEKLKNLKRIQGFTDKYGQCGFCLKSFLTFKRLLLHRKECQGRRKGVRLERSKLIWFTKKSTNFKFQI